jgi:hypothetical protein
MREPDCGSLPGTLTIAAKSLVDRSEAREIRRLASA